MWKFMMNIIWILLWTTLSRHKWSGALYWISSEVLTNVVLCLLELIIRGSQPGRSRTFYFDLETTRKFESFYLYWSQPLFSLVFISSVTSKNRNVLIFSSNYLKWSDYFYLFFKWNFQLLFFSSKFLCFAYKLNEGKFFSTILTLYSCSRILFSLTYLLCFIFTYLISPLCHLRFFTSLE